jgi:KaiC/GvpD/RAD55 family RecA-like ATPase
VFEKDSATLLREMKTLQEQYTAATRREKIAKLRKDVRLADEIEKLQNLFFMADFDKARSVSANIWRALNVQSALSANTDFEKHLADYRSTGRSIKMPAEWGFTGEFEMELERGLLYMLGARPGTGKTTVGLNLAYYYAKLHAELGYKVLFLTNEMKPGQCWAKLRQIDMNHRDGKLRPFMLVKNYIRYPDKFTTEHQAVREMASGMSKNFAMASVRKMEAPDICMVVQESKNYFGADPDIVFLDYLQRVPRGKQTDARLGLIETVQSFSELALDLDCVWFIMSQMNQSGGFKESEAPEEEAGIAWEISRDELKDGRKAAHINWKVKKTRISGYSNVQTFFDDVSGTILHKG